MKITFRKPILADLETLLELEQGIINFERPFYLTLKEDKINYYDLKSMITSSDVFVAIAEFDGEFIGSRYARIENGKPLKNKPLNDKIFGKIYGDNGYLGKDLFDQLLVDGIHLITKVRKNMKKKAMTFTDRVLLRKRAVIKSINDILKNVCYIEYTRHRSVDNFAPNLASRLYSLKLFTKKPSIKMANMLPNISIS